MPRRDEARRPAVVQPDEDRVIEELGRQAARQEATQRLRAQTLFASWKEPPSVATLADELALPDEQTAWSVEGVLPSGGNALLTGAAKIGKTTVLANLVRAKADGRAFLGKLACRPLEGTVALWNYELTRDQCRTWLRDQGIKHPERVCVLNLRGYPMPLSVPELADWAAEWLQAHEVEIWLPDPLTRVFQSFGSENSTDDMGRFFAVLDEIKQRAGVRELVMSAHTGVNEGEEGKERPRGSSQQTGWPDAIWYLTRDDKRNRYFRASGRDVDLEEARLEYHEATRRMRLAGGSRADTRADGLVGHVLLAVRAQPGIVKRDLRDRVQKAGHASNSDVDKAVDKAVENGDVRVEKKGVAMHHWIIEKVTEK